MAFTRITSDPAVMQGQPCIKGTRVTVKRVLLALSMYPDRSEFFANYPSVDEAAVQEALQYGAAMIADEIVELPAS